MTVGLLSVTTFPVILRERSEPKDLLQLTALTLYYA